jgi:mycothiol synthase
MDDIPALVRLFHAVEVAAAGRATLAEETLRHQFATPGLGLAERTWVLPGREDGLVAVAMAIPVPVQGGLQVQITCHVHPDRAGDDELAGAVIAHAEARARAALAGSGDGTSSVVFHALLKADDPQGPRFSGRGYQPVRWFVNLRRGTAPPVAASPLPSGFTSRRLVPGPDTAVLLDVVQRAFADHWQTPQATEAQFAHALSTPGVETTGSSIACDGSGAPAGAVLALLRPRADQAGKVIVIQTLAVLDAHRGRGLGRALLTHALAEGFAAGATLSMLDVDHDNRTGALALYQRLGFAEHRRRVAWQKPVR